MEHTSPNGNGRLVQGLVSSRLLPIAGTALVLLVTAVAGLFLHQSDAKIADHQRWLVYLQNQQDGLRDKTDTVAMIQSERKPIVDAAARTTELVQEIRTEVAMIQQHLTYLTQAMVRVEQLQRRELRALEDR